jgi:hypothetical protein
MEFVEYMPGALAAGWMAFKLVVLLRDGPAVDAVESSVIE